MRRLHRDGDTLNLTLCFDNELLDIDCNFHTDPDDNDAAIAAVEPERIVRLRNMAIAILSERYGLELEEEKRWRSLIRVRLPI